jgi:carotenoid 1,2-hydratase
MYDVAAHPDGWHAVASPGGYEWWYFDAESLDGRTRLVAILLEGFVFHPGYLRAYGRFRRNPTKITPPVAGDFPVAYLCLYRDQKIASQFITQVPPGEFDASPDGPRVTLGRNSLHLDDAGDYRLRMTGHPWRVTTRGPVTDRGRTLDADLTFAPIVRHEPMERTFLSREMTDADHKWVLAAPCCRVAGTVAGEDFTGLGYHDHNYGTAPLGPGLRRWVWGRILDDDSADLFHHAEPRDASLPAESHRVTLRNGELAESDAAIGVTWGRRSTLGLPYPSTIRLGDDVTLSQPTVVDNAPFYLRATYDAGSGRRAFCEIAHPHRLRWPILGRMIEMSIDKPELSGVSRR